MLGKKNQPVFRVVVKEKRSNRDGVCLDNLGIYDPNQKPPVINIDRKKLDEWVKNGAGISNKVRELISTK